MSHTNTPSDPLPNEHSSTQSQPPSLLYDETTKYLSTEPAPPHLAGGSQPTGRYQILPEHAPKVGGMGRVHRATDTELRRVVAFKDIKPDKADTPLYRELLVTEAEVTGNLEHPGIVPVYGLGRDVNGRPYYAMRYIDGESLGEAVGRFHNAKLSGRDAALELRRLLSRFVSVCQTVAFAHSRGVLHRDLKPDNVMLGPFGETLVVDWGITAQVGSKGAAGTASYWAPEQSPNRLDQLDERTDVYGLGAILFHILTDRPPHPDKVHTPEPPNPKAVRSVVDDALDAITRRALAILPADRYQSAQELAKVIEEWLADQPVLAQRALVGALADKVEAAPGNGGLREQLARQQFNLGLMLAGMGRDGEAATLFQGAATAYQRLNAHAGDPEPRLLSDEANCRLAAARSLEAIGSESLAVELKRQAELLLRSIIATSRDQFAVDEASVMLTHHGFDLPERAPARGDPPGLETVDIPPPSPSRPADSTDSDGRKSTPAPGDESSEPTPGTTLHPTEHPAREVPGFDFSDLPSGGFTPIREIGRGGSSAVFLATDNRLQRQVAVKVLSHGLAMNATARERALREMRLTATLEHPNIVRVYQSGERRDGAPFLVMEHLDGVDLRQRMAELGPGWSADHLEPFAQVCDALHYAHTRGVIHRDPKPSNVMVLSAGRVVLFDWGLAKQVGAPDPTGEGVTNVLVADNPDLTQEGFVMGTPAYMSPEQVSGEISRLGPASDIFIVGSGLFEVVIGRKACDGNTMLEIIQKVMKGQYSRLRDVRPDVPADLDAIVSKAMAFRPEDRYATAAALATDLRAFLAGQPPSVRPHRGLWDWFRGFTG